MTLSNRLRNILVIAPHADDEVLGCGGLMAKVADTETTVHVVYMAVDSFHHYGSDDEVSYTQRIVEIEAVAKFLNFSWEIIFAGQGLIEKLDTIPKRDLVDICERIFNTQEPELLLLPSGVDYDQDHRQTFETAFAAARPIARQFGKWLIPHVMAYEQNKMNFAWENLPRPAAFSDISDHLEAKLEAVQLYKTQLRPPPHVRSLDGIRGLACIRGSEIGTRYAEAFQVFRTMV